MTSMRRYTRRELAAARLNILPACVYDAFQSVLFGRVLVIATRLGVFEALSKRPQTAGELAATLALDRGSLELVLSALVETSYLRCRRDRFFIAPQSGKWLLRSSPHYVGNFLAYIELLHHHWSDLEGTLRSGVPVKTYRELFGPNEWEIYTLGMRDLAAMTWPFIRTALRMPGGNVRLLDLGGSHAFYSMQLCRAIDGLKAVVMDLPEVLGVTARLVRGSGLEDRISLVPGDIHSLALERGQFDVVLAFNIIHGFTAETNRTLFKTIGSALAPGGILYILDQLRTDRGSGVARLLPIMVGLNLVNEIGGTTYTMSDVQSWCDGAGLGTALERRLRLPGVTLVRVPKAD